MIKKYQSTNLLGATSIGLLVIALLISIFPSVSGDVKAEEARATVNLKTNAAVSIALEDSSINLETTPKTNGSFTTGSSIVKVETNNTTGYQLYLSTVSEEATLINSTDPSNKIIPLSEEATEPTFTVNSWGYNFEKGESSGVTFNGMSGIPTVVKNTTTANATIPDIYTLSIAAKVNSKIPAGTYSNQIVISAVANPVELNTMMDLVYMQDMTPELCVATPMNEDLKQPLTKQLIDVRDGKSYFVAKLADGNCWMTQNLDLDITPQMIAQNSLNSSNTDLHSGTVWGTNSVNSTTDDMNSCGTNSTAVNCQIINGKAHYTPTNTTFVSQSSPLTNTPISTLNSNTRSYDFGKWVIKDPSSGDNGACDPADITSFSDCLAGFVEVSNPKWRGTWNYDEKFTTFNEDTFEYDPHFLIGNSYSYNTATAGSGGTIVYANAKDSICPKGWKLPTAGDTSNIDNIKSGSFYNLANSYGLTTTGTSVDTTTTIWFRNSVGGTNPTSWTNTGIASRQYHIGAGDFSSNTAPLYFVNVGRTVIQRDIQSSANSIAYLWSATAGSSSDRAFWAQFSPMLNSVSYTTSNGRFHGFNIRCLAW